MEGTMGKTPRIVLTGAALGSRAPSSAVYRPALGVGLLLVAVSVLLAGCAGTGAGTGKDYAVRKVYGEGTAVQVVVLVSKDDLTSVEELELILQTRAAENWKVQFPEISDKIGKFQVVQRGTEDRELDRDENLVTTRRYTLEPFLPGDYSIPPLQISFGQKGTEYPFSMETGEIPISVTSVLPPQVGEQQIEEVAGPEEQPRAVWPWIVGGFGLVTVAGAGTTLGLWARRKRRRVDEEPQESEPTPEDAFEELVRRTVGFGTLSTEATGPETPQHPEESSDAYRPEELYRELSYLMRRAIERHYGIPATEQTTEELRGQLPQTLEGRSRREKIVTVLEQCDLVKFARQRPERATVEETVRTVRELFAELSSETGSQESGTSEHGGTE